MKKIIFLMLMFVSVNVMAQESYKVFCELLGMGKFMSTKVIVTVDFGQKTKYWSGDAKQYLVDDEGEKLEFNSMVDAMNQNTYHWLLSKKVTSDEQLKEGLITKEEYDKKHKK